MRSLRAGWIFVVTSLFLVVPPTAGWHGVAADQPTDVRRLYWQVDPDGKDGPIAVGDEVADSETRLSRDSGGISYKIRTSGLLKEHGYTVWFLSYDAPEFCVFGKGGTGTRCAVFDLLFNPAAQGSLMWGRSGKFVEGHGTTIFSGRRPVNETPCATEPAVVDDDCSGVLWGRGLTDPMRAEIHFVLRDHGPDQDDVEDETTTINGGCKSVTPKNPMLHDYYAGWGTPGTYACYDRQGN